VTLRANGAETTFDVRLELIKHIIRCVATGFDTQKKHGRTTARSGNAQDMHVAAHSSVVGSKVTAISDTAVLVGDRLAWPLAPNDPRADLTQPAARIFWAVAAFI
jgi:hypothetical protein